MPSPYFTSADVDAIWSKDVDSSAGTQTAYGAVFTTNSRVGAITNTQLPAIIATLTAIQADLTAIRDELDKITADPADPAQGHDHVIVAAVEWADAN
jgi:cob(I)alamin adenosyltransferase